LAITRVLCADLLELRSNDIISRNLGSITESGQSRSGADHLLSKSLDVLSGDLLDEVQDLRELELTEAHDVAAHLLNQGGADLDRGKAVRDGLLLSALELLSRDGVELLELLDDLISEVLRIVGSGDTVDTEDTAVVEDGAEAQGGLNLRVGEDLLVKARAHALARTTAGEGRTTTQEGLENGQGCNTLGVRPVGRLEAESNVSKALIVTLSLANLTTSVDSRLSKLSNVRRRLASALKELTDGGSECLVIDTDGGEDHAVGGEEVVEPGEQDRGGHVVDAGSIAVQGLAKGLATVSSLEEHLIDADVDGLESLLNVIEVRVALLLALTLKESRVLEQVCEGTNRDVSRISRSGDLHSEGVAGSLSGDLGGSAAHLASEAEGRAVGRALEEHTLKEVGDTRILSGLIARTNIDERSSLEHRSHDILSDDLHARREGGHLDITLLRRDGVLLDLAREHLVQGHHRHARAVQQSVQESRSGRWGVDIACIRELYHESVGAGKDNDMSFWQSMWGTIEWR